MQRQQGRSAGPHRRLLYFRFSFSLLTHCRHRPPGEDTVFLFRLRRRDHCPAFRRADRPDLFELTQHQRIAHIRDIFIIRADSCVSFMDRIRFRGFRSRFGSCRGFCFSRGGNDHSRDRFRRPFGVIDERAESLSGAQRALCGLRGSGHAVGGFHGRALFFRRRFIRLLEKFLRPVQAEDQVLPAQLTGKKTRADRRVHPGGDLHAFSAFPEMEARDIQQLTDLHRRSPRPIVVTAFRIIFET